MFVRIKSRNKKAAIRRERLSKSEWSPLQRASMEFGITPKIKAIPGNLIMTIMLYYGEDMSNRILIDSYTIWIADGPVLADSLISGVLDWVGNFITRSSNSSIYREQVETDSSNITVGNKTIECPVGQPNLDNMYPCNYLLYEETISRPEGYELNASPEEEAKELSIEFSDLLDDILGDYNLTM